MLGEWAGEDVRVRGVMVGTEPERCEEVFGLVLAGPELVRDAGKKII